MPSPIAPPIGVEAWQSRFRPARLVEEGGPGRDGKEPGAPGFPKAVLVGLEPYLAYVQGNQGFPRVQYRLVCQGDFPDVTRWYPAAPLNFSPLLRCASKVFGLLGEREALATYFSEAPLPVSFPWRHQATPGSMPYGQWAARNAVGHGCEPTHWGEHVTRRKRHLRRLCGWGGGGSARRDRSHVSLYELGYHLCNLQIRGGIEVQKRSPRLLRKFSRRHLNPWQPEIDYQAPSRVHR